MSKKPEVEYEVYIDLLEDVAFPKIQCLQLSDENGGLRIGGGKGIGSWRTIKRFKCNIKLSDLKEYQIKSDKK